MPAHAEATVSFRFAFDTAELVIGPSQVANIPIYLEEVRTDGSSSLLVAEQGLAGFGIRASFDVAGDQFSFTSASVNELSFYGPSDPLFGPVISVGSNAVTMIGFATGPGVTGSEVSPQVRRLLLGSLSVRGGSTEGQTARIILGDRSSLTEDNVLWESFDTIDADLSTDDRSSDSQPFSRRTRGSAWMLELEPSHASSAMRFLLNPKTCMRAAT
jgi:hypothetical protein